MNKNYICLIILIFIVTIFALTRCDMQKEKYPSGKDTVESFEGGIYQIMRNPDRSLSFTNLDISTDIEKKIKDYKKTNNQLFIKGSIGYTVFNLKTYTIKQYVTFEGYTDSEIQQYRQFFEPDIKKLSTCSRLEKYEDFSKEERRIFETLKSSGGIPRL
ncbi:hypothetical protein [Phosphitispora sp. TUW77]|uniref:hypothetical protein n=1 Tax=Phosphitispora sp. TUW77 TaxID=3152361 RepID=UPI003AB3D0D8